MTEEALPEEQLLREAAAFSNVEYQSSDLSQQFAMQAQQRGNAKEAPKQKPITHAEKTGRNEPCPCGSGKKFKHCCGK